MSDDPFLERSAESTHQPDTALDEVASLLEPVPMQPVPPPERRTRAGRNLTAAIAVGLGLAALILASLYVWKVAFLGVAAVAVVLGLSEMANALGANRIHLPVVPVAIGGVAILVAAFAGGPEAMVVSLGLTVLAVMAWRLPDEPPGDVAAATAGVFTTLYVPFLTAFSLLLLRENDGADRVVVFVLLTALSDVGGYAAGVLFGRHPLAASISPKKSWEGFAGSGLFCVTGGAVALPLLLGGSAVVGAACGLAVVLTATLGDLGESMIKRDLDIKDMGSLLPGHGGIMDRLDSLLPVAPVIYVLLSWWVPA